MANNKDGLKIWVGYARRSIEKADNEERVASIEDQRQEIYNIAEKEGFHVTKVFEETKSGKTAGLRTEFNEMMKQIKAGKINSIICWKLNRLARNFLEGGQIIEYLQKGVIKEIRTHERKYLPTDNVMTVAVELGMANQYSIDLASDVRRGLYGQAKRGYRPTGAPIGYKNSRYHQKGKEEEILVDENTFPQVRKLFDLMLGNDHSRHQLFLISKKLNLSTGKGKGKFKPLSKSQIYNVLTNTFYYGEFEYPRGSGKWYQGNHKPMITKEEYDKIQILLRSKGRPRPQTKVFAYTGLLKCGHCGSNVTAEQKNKIQKNGNIHQYTYYLCTRKGNHCCTAKAINGKMVDEEIEKMIKQIEIPRSFHDWAVETLKKMHEREKKDRNSTLYEKQRAYDEVVKWLDSLLDMKLDRKISDEDYEKKKADLEHKKNYLKGFLDNIDSRIDEWFKKIEKDFDFAESARLKFETATLEEKRSILSSLSQNRIIKDGKITIELEEPLKLIGNALPEVKKITESPEPQEPNDLKVRFDNSDLLCAR